MDIRWIIKRKLYYKRILKGDEWMQRYAWKGHIKEGMLEEYIRRHNSEFWPEMREALTKAGIHNYSIWNVGNEVFGYLECDESVETYLQIQSECEVVKKWNLHMSDILIKEIDEKTGKPYVLKQVFLHK